MSTQEEIAWAAGFYEGEGNCTGGISSSGRRRIFGLRISQVNQEPLQRMIKLFGGKIYSLRRSHLTRHDGYHCNDAGSWELHGNEAKKFANLIYPLLSQKRRMQIFKIFMSLPVPKIPVDKEEQKIRWSKYSSKWWRTRGKFRGLTIVKTPATCHPGRRMRAFGLCSKCYQAQYYQNSKKEK